MNSSFSYFRTFFIVFLFLLFIIIFISSFFFYSSNNITNSNSSFIFNYPISSNFAWPAPGFTRITSTFGPRNKPTTGASSFHYGIDIGAPAGSNLVSSIDGKVIYADFNRCEWLYYKNRK